MMPEQPLVRSLGEHARQRADDLPAVLDLDDVAAAYDGYVADLRGQLDTR